VYSFEPGVYSAERQLDIVVTFGGEIKDDPDHHGPWVQWCFLTEEEHGLDQFCTTAVWEFKEMVEAAGYKLREPRPSKGFRIAA